MNYIRKFFNIKIIFILCLIFTIFIVEIKINKNNFFEESVLTFIQDADNKEVIKEPQKSFNLYEFDKDFLPNIENFKSLITLSDYQKYLYTIDKTAFVTKEDLDIDAFALENLKLNLKSKEPKILIFHTHSQEAFINSRKGVESDTIVGVGQKLSEILADNYNISVVHDTGKYDIDLKTGKERREDSYSIMEPAVKAILRKYPSIEVVIDLHRDGVPDNVYLTKEIDGVKVAKLMFFNGITRKNENGLPKEMPNLPNKYLKENLAFSFQMQIMSNTLFPGLSRRIYIKPYRYSLHLKPKSLLVEVGANTNTIEEAKNAMYPLAKILVNVLS